MAKIDTFTCSIITPERVALECDARFVALPAHDGEVGILRDRAPLMCKLGIGVLRISAAEKGGSLFIDGGFAQVVENRVTVLTEQAKSPEEIDAKAAEQDLSEAHAMRITDEASFFARSKAIKRAQTQLKLVRG